MEFLLTAYNIAFGYFSQSHLRPYPETGHLLVLPSLATNRVGEAILIEIAPDCCTARFGFCNQGVIGDLQKRTVPLIAIQVVIRGLEPLLVT